MNASAKQPRNDKFLTAVSSLTQCNIVSGRYSQKNETNKSNQLGTSQKSECLKTQKFPQQIGDKSQASLMTAMTLKTSKDLQRNADSRQSSNHMSGYRSNHGNSRPRSNSGKSARNTNEVQNNSRSKSKKIEKSLNKLMKMQNIEKADSFFRSYVIRKHFCVWIEKYIEVLKVKRTCQNDNYSWQSTIQPNQ